MTNRTEILMHTTVQIPMGKIKIKMSTLKQEENITYKR